MDLITLFFLAVGLSMDAFAVSVCKGLSLKKITIKKAVWVGVWFGGFQGLMPVVGYLLGVQFKSKIVTIDHWIAFILLLLIGGNMIRESLSKEEDKKNDSLSIQVMFLLAVATSIDALAIGVTFAFLQVNLMLAAIFIGVITFVFSIIGVKVGHRFKEKYKSKAEMFGGGILILLGFKILLEHIL